MHSEKFSSTWQVINMIMIILAALFEYNWCELVRNAVNAWVMYWPGRGCTVNIYSASCGPGTQNEQRDAAHPILLKFRYVPICHSGWISPLRFDRPQFSSNPALDCWGRAAGVPSLISLTAINTADCPHPVICTAAPCSNAVKINKVFFSCSLIFVHCSFATKFSTTTVI